MFINKLFNTFFHCQINKKWNLSPQDFIECGCSVVTSKRYQMKLKFESF
jgi:hypothetical protein